MANQSFRKSSNGRNKTQAKHPSMTLASRLVWSGKVLTGIALVAGLVYYASGAEVGAHEEKKQTEKAPTAKLDKALKKLVNDDSNKEVPVIVTYKDGAAAKIEQKLAKKGKKADKHIEGLNNVVVKMKAEDMEDFAADSDVKGLSLDANVESFTTGESYTLRSTLDLLTGPNRPRASPATKSSSP